MNYSKDELSEKGKAFIEGMEIKDNIISLYEQGEVKEE